MRKEVGVWPEVVGLDQEVHGHHVFEAIDDVAGEPVPPGFWQIVKILGEFHVGERPHQGIPEHVRDVWIVPAETGIQPPRTKPPGHSAGHQSQGVV